jgi:bacterial/archaeal transporter family-2 protein
VDRPVAVVLTLLGGGLVALQPPSNELLARHVGSLGAAFVSLVISTGIVAVLLVAAGEPSELRGLAELRPVHVWGGLGGAAIVVITLITVSALGASGVVAALVSSQLIVAAVLDRLGVLGLEKTELTWGRGTGIALLIVGTALVTWR